MKISGLWNWNIQTRTDRTVYENIAAFKTHQHNLHHRILSLFFTGNKMSEERNVSHQVPQVSTDNAVGVKCYENVIMYVVINMGFYICHFDRK